MVDHMVDRQYYDETYLAKVGATAEKKLGEPHVCVCVCVCAHVCVCDD